MSAADRLDEMANTFRERNTVYSNNYERIGGIMAAMFPDGLQVRSQEDWVRLYFLLATVAKTSRYATNWWRGGHADSAHDAAVYFAMLEDYDRDRKADREVASGDGAQAANETAGASADERHSVGGADTRIQP